MKTISNFIGVSVGRLVQLFECHWCKQRVEIMGEWKGRAAGPQCPCNPNSWGNWILIDTKPANGMHVEGRVHSVPSLPNAKSAATGSERNENEQAKEK